MIAFPHDLGLEDSVGLDRLLRIAAFDFREDIHPFNHTTERRVQAVQVLGRHEREKELGSTRVRPGVRHAQRAAEVLAVVRLAAFTRDAVARTSAPGTLRASRLCHEGRNHTVECQTVIESFLDERNEIGYAEALSTKAGALDEVNVRRLLLGSRHQFTEEEITEIIRFIKEHEELHKEYPFLQDHGILEIQAERLKQRSKQPLVAREVLHLNQLLVDMEGQKPLRQDIGNTKRIYLKTMLKRAITKRLNLEKGRVRVEISDIEAGLRIKVVDEVNTDLIAAITYTATHNKDLGTAILEFPDFGLIQTLGKLPK